MFLQTLSFSQFNPIPFPGDFILPKPPNPCINSGFESGTFNNWETFVGGVTPTTGGINLSSFIQTFDNSQHKIVNANTIDIIGAFNQGNCGNKAAKVGDNVPGPDLQKSSMIKYTFTVTPANVNFSFRYALVLDDPNIINPGSHTPSQKPFIQYMLLQGNTSAFTTANLITSKKFVADGNNPFYTALSNGIVYKDWSTECINLSAYMGQQVSFLFIEADCALGAHGAYAYVDCLCENNDAIASMTLNGNDFCLDDPIIMDGSATVNEDSYFVSIAESDAYWYVIPGTEKSQWFVAQQTGNIDISALANQLGFQFQCNRYYKIKLAVSNSCVPWNETSELIYIRCPEDVGIGQDINLCCNSLFPITIEDENYSDHPTYTYNWISNPPWLVQNPTVPAFTYTPHQSATFNVTVTDDYGCTLEDELNVIIEQDFEVTLSYEELGCCSKLLMPSINLIKCEGIFEEDPTWKFKKLQQLTYLWSDGSTDMEHQVNPNQNTTYTLTVSNACYSHTASITVPKTPSGNFTTLITASGFTPSSSNPLANKLIIREFGPTAPFDGQPAYNATGYWLTVYSRWGGMVRKVKEIKVNKKCPLLQGEIVWDGTDDNGNILPIGVYVYTLQLKNECRGVDWTNSCDFFGSASSNATNCAKQCWQWWPPGLVCCESLACPYDVTLYN